MPRVGSRKFFLLSKLVKVESLLKSCYCFYLFFIEARYDCIFVGRFPSIFAIASISVFAKNKAFKLERVRSGNES